MCKRGPKFGTSQLSKEVKPSKASLQEAVFKGGPRGVCSPGSAVALPREHDIAAMLLSTL